MTTVNNTQSTKSNSKGETMKKEPKLVVDNKEMTMNDVIQEEIKRTKINGGIKIDNKMKRFDYSNGNNTVTGKQKQRVKNENYPQPLLEKRMKEKKERDDKYIEGYQRFEEQTSNKNVGWEPLLKSNISDETINEKIREFNEKVSSSKLDFVKVCVETILLRSWEYLGHELRMIGFTSSSISKLRSVCSNKNIRKYLEVLPTSWGTLYEMRNTDERGMERLTGYRYENGSLIKNGKNNHYDVNQNSSKNYVKSCVLDMREEELSDDDKNKLMVEWFKEWSQTKLEYFYLGELNEVLDRCNGNQKRELVDWVRKTENLFVTHKVPSEVNISLRLKK
jgi:hypothetical protein